MHSFPCYKAKATRALTAPNTIHEHVVYIYIYICSRSLFGNANKPKLLIRALNVRLGVVQPGSWPGWNKHSHMVLSYQRPEWGIGTQDTGAALQSWRSNCKEVYPPPPLHLPFSWHRFSQGYFIRTVLFTESRLSPEPLHHTAHIHLHILGIFTSAYTLSCLYLAQSFSSSSTAATTLPTTLWPHNLARHQPAWLAHYQLRDSQFTASGCQWL